MDFPRRQRLPCRLSARVTACGSSRSWPRSGEGSSKIRLGSDGARFVLILLKVITIFSPLRLFVPISGALFAVGAAYARLDDRHAGARHQFIRAVDLVEHRDSADRPDLRTDCVAAVRRAAIVSRVGARHHPDLQRAREHAGARRRTDEARRRARPGRRRQLARRHRCGGRGTGRVNTRDASRCCTGRRTAASDVRTSTA